MFFFYKFIYYLHVHYQVYTNSVESRKQILLHFPGNIMAS